MTASSAGIPSVMHRSGSSPASRTSRSRASGSSASATIRAPSGLHATQRPALRQFVQRELRPVLQELPVVLKFTHVQRYHVTVLPTREFPVSDPILSARPTRHTDGWPTDRMVSLETPSAGTQSRGVDNARIISAIRSTVLVSFPVSNPWRSVAFLAILELTSSKARKAVASTRTCACATASIQPSPTSMRSCELAPMMRRSRQQQRQGCRSRRAQGGFVRRWRGKTEAVGRLPLIAIFSAMVENGLQSGVTHHLPCASASVALQPERLLLPRSAQPRNHPASLTRAKSSAFRSNPFLVSRQIEFRPSRNV